MLNFLLFGKASTGINPSTVASIPDLATGESPTPSGSSQVDGKKRAIDEDDDATATDDENPASTKRARKKRGQLK